ncbi:UPF0182 family protein, partial [Rothia nasimurium]
MNTASTPPRSTPPRSPRNTPLGITAAIIAVLVVVFVFVTQVYTDILWYDQLGYLKVFITQNLTKGAVFLAAGLLTGLAVWASIFYAYKHGTPPTPG